MLKLVNDDRGRVVCKKQPRVAFRLSTLIKRVKGDEPPFGSRYFPQESCLSNLPCACQEQDREEFIRVKKRLFKFSVMAKNMRVNNNIFRKRKKMLVFKHEV